jgi:beta-lactamase superfamily II metal-dependent hydrolase
MLKLTALGVGHGDATLLQVFSEDKSEKPAFTCLVDGGESSSKLASALDRHGVRDLDLLVLSHFDADHIGGLDDIWAGRQVRSFWAPCLPAFERHIWLFGKRIQSGFAHARAVSKSMGISTSFAKTYRYVWAN